MPALLVLALLGILCLPVACHSPIQVKSVDKIDNDWEHGVPFYFPKQIRRKFELTKLEKDGQIIGVAPHGCDRIEDAEYVTVANFDQLHMIRSWDFFFGQNTFAVTLDKGLLASVNSIRDPQLDEMVSAVAGAVTTFAAAGVGPAGEAAPTEGLRPDCNAGKRYREPLP